jgi:hypothetical protein
MTSSAYVATDRLDELGETIGHRFGRTHPLVGRHIERAADKPFELVLLKLGEELLEKVFLARHRLCHDDVGA